MNVRLPRGSRVKAFLNPSSIRHFLDIPAEVVDEDHRMASGKGLLTGAKTRCDRCLCKLFAKDSGG